MYLITTVIALEDGRHKAEAMLILFRVWLSSETIRETSKALGNKTYPMVPLSGRSNLT
jgi:hypothetical protein